MNLEQLLTQYRDMKTELMPAMSALAELEKQIKDHCKETGETCEIEGAKVMVRNGYERTSWDGKALAGYAVAHPEINQFCKVSQVAPAITIKVGGQ